MSIKEALKALAEALTGSTVSGASVAEVITALADAYEPPTDGAKGDTGAYITAIELEVDGGGAVVGGTATLSDSTEVSITITTAD